MNPALRYEDITKSQKTKFIRALSKLLRWGQAVYHHKGHSRIAIQFGYKLNLLPTASTANTENTANSMEPTAKCTIANCPTAIDPSTLLSAKEFERFTTLLQVGKQWKKGIPPRERGVITRFR